MNTLKFDAIKDYNKWCVAEDGGYETIYNGDDCKFVCNVLLKDYEYLYSIGFVNFHGVILNPLTDEQLRTFVENYGVNILIAEELLQLTCEQMAAVEELEAAFRKAKELGVLFISQEYDSRLFAVNYERFHHISNDYCIVDDEKYIDVDMGRLEKWGKSICDQEINFGCCDADAFPLKFELKN